MTRYDLIDELYKSRVKRFASNDETVLELNKSKLAGLIEKKRNKYVDTFGSGLETEIILPALVFLLNNVANNIIDEGYEFTKARLKEYLSKISKRKITESLPWTHK